MYIWDIHASSIFKIFIEKYNDDNTTFISLWDIFDRGPSSYENYLIIKELFEKEKYSMVLWNHDLFFIFWIWLSEKYNWFLLKQLKGHKRYNDYLSLWKEAYSYLVYNWWEETLDSILERHSWLYWQKVSNLSEDEQNERLNEIARFLYQFNIYQIDENKNLLVHWGIPILNDWSTVLIQEKKEITKTWLETLEVFNKWFRELDLWFLIALVTWASSEYNDFNILYDMKNHNVLKNPKLMESLLNRIDTSTHFIPTWYLNDFYFSHEIAWKTLKEELKKENLNALIVWHCGNNIPEEWFCNIDSDYWKHLLTQTESLIRLDRSFIKKFWAWWNFWYLLVRDWIYIEVWDSLDLLKK